MRCAFCSILQIIHSMSRSMIIGIDESKLNEMPVFLKNDQYQNVFLYHTQPLSPNLPLYHRLYPSNIKRFQDNFLNPTWNFEQFQSWEEQQAMIISIYLNDPSRKYRIFTYPFLLEDDSISSYLTLDELNNANWIVDSKQRRHNPDAILFCPSEFHHL